jgi:hypothetical protein
MRCSLLGTGAYIDRYVAWFNDAMRLSVPGQFAGAGPGSIQSGAGAAARAGDAPSLVTALAELAA